MAMMHLKPNLEEISSSNPEIPQVLTFLEIQYSSRLDFHDVKINIFRQTGSLFVELCTKFGSNTFYNC